MGTNVMGAATPQPAAAGSAAEQSVVVAMATYQRPDELARTLRTILAQIDDAGLTARIQVVDNDPTGSAAGTITALGDDRVRYVQEPTPGIAAARNRALDEAADDDVLIFIDDDEDPQPGWLVNLLTVYRANGVAAVVGPVVSEYDGALDEWILAGGFFERRRLATGTSVEAAATNNLLLDLNRIRSLGLRFDQQFGLSGGSDTLFTRQLTGAGEQIIWCDQAVVVDHVPTARMTRGWVLRRARRYGEFVEQDLAGVGAPGPVPPARADRDDRPRCDPGCRRRGALPARYGDVLPPPSGARPAHPDEGRRLHHGRHRGSPGRILTARGGRGLIGCVAGHGPSCWHSSAPARRPGGG